MQCFGIVAALRLSAATFVAFAAEANVAPPRHEIGQPVQEVTRRECDAAAGAPGGRAFRP